MASGWITIGTELDTKKFDMQIAELEDRLQDLEGQELYFSDNEMAGELQDVQVEIEKTKNKLLSLKKQKDKAAEPSNINQMSSAFKSVGSSIQNTIGKVGKLVLGIFAIRSAYMAVRRASSELASYDSQYAANIEYIRYALTQMIAPVLRWIVQMAATLLRYINMIVNALFGINLFSKASADSFKKMKSSAGGVAKAAQEIKKQLAGFDELNVLQEQTDTSGGGGGGVATPEFDLSALEGEPPKWLKWIADNKDIILAVMAGVAAGLLAWKLGFSALTSLGIGLVITGIVYAIQSLIAYLQDPSFFNFGKIIEGIGIAIIGIGVIIGSLPAVIAGVIVLIVGIIVKYWEQIKAFLQNGINWLTSKSDWVHEHLGGVVGFIYDLIVGAFQAILDMFDALINAIKGIFDGFIMFFKGVFTGDWKMAWEGIKKIFTSIWEGIKGILGAFADWVSTKIIDPVINLFKGLWDKLKTGAQNAWNGIKNVFSTVASFFKNIFTNAWTAVKNVFSVGGKIFDGIKEGIVNAFKTIVNAIIKGINKVVAIPFNAINSVLRTIRNISILGVQPFTWVHTISVPQIPLLKTGGIINMPNRGTMVGGMAIGGEAGREGVIPLTDQQAMAELGREIGKNVLVNLTNITTMNGRILSRELKNIQSEQDFAYNQ